MSSINEEYDNQLKSAIKQGYDTLSRNQEITFTQYVQVVLPFDGFVFWIKADIISQSALLNAFRLNQICLNKVVSTIAPAPQIVVDGSLHYATRTDQREDESIGVNTVIFTTQEEIQDFNSIGPKVIYIAEFDGIRFAFSEHANLYKQADTYHYRGFAIYPAMESQIIDRPQDFDRLNVVVSNSLPIWLSLDKFMPIYPSYLVPNNIKPPYATIHIDPSKTEGIQSSPLITSTSSHYQLTFDSVYVTMYGLRNFSALDYLDYIGQFTLDNDTLMGLSNIPIVIDEKRTQSELNILAMKKSIVFRVNYYQTRINDLTRQLILSAVPTYYFGQG